MNIEQNIKQFLIRIGLLKDWHKVFLNSYHYQRALELSREGKDGDAADELNEEFNEHPDNGLAHMLMAEIHKRHNNYGTALKACNKAIYHLSVNGLPMDLAHAYWLRSQVNYSLGDRDSWKSDGEKSVKADSKSVDGWGVLGDYHYYLGQYDKSDEMFNKIIELEPHNPYGYMGRGRNDEGRGKYEAAIKHYERAALLDDNYVAAHTFKAQSLVELGKLAEAADELVEAIKIDRDDRKIHPLMERIINLGGYEVLQLKVQALVVQNPDESFLHSMMGWIHFGKPDFKRSIQAYDKAFELSRSGEMKHFASYGWNRLGNNDKAIECEKIAVSMNPKDKNLRYNLAGYYADEGKYDEAIELLDNLITEAPDVPDAYFRRGRCYQRQGMLDEALKDFNIAIALKDNHAQVYLFAGLALRQLGREQEAMKMFQMIVDDESLEERELVLGWTLCELGNTKDARNEVDARVTDADAATSWRGLEGIYFFAMITYCRLGMVRQALECARNYFDRGYGFRFYLLRHDEYFSFLQNEENFIKILDENEQRLIKIQQELLNEMPSQQSVNSQTAEIPYTKEGKMCKVQCKVNDLPLHFIFDTGAADVSLSSVEATFMLKNGYLKREDMSGKEYYTTADGSVAEGVKVNLREVEFGGLKLNNVKAGVVTNQRAPLLLGQSVLARLGRIEIDNERQVIKVNG